ncbi:hypothetical protein KDA_11650 [Dictyobacter alpinus]|uniref:histidine kinase n=1 Tax=Dictyobacter alpinus TaxID=2014873 RepID=A0A402B2V5_9CHLR|nr:HAMP domain-containing sensor histidine kinase [Dictyobacter alpinus]GCE25681.1 hypothetical protein KDA_11650 [Dictyobacter alpinus]
MGRDSKELHHAAPLNGPVLSIDSQEPDQLPASEAALAVEQEDRRMQEVLASLDVLVTILLQQYPSPPDTLVVISEGAEVEEVESTIMARCVECIRQHLTCHAAMLAEFSQEAEMVSPLACSGTTASYVQYWADSIKLNTILQNPEQFQCLCAGEILTLELTSAVLSDNHPVHRMIIPILRQTTLIGLLFLDYGVVQLPLKLSEIAVIKSLSGMLALAMQRDQEQREHARIVSTLQAANVELTRMNTLKNNFISTINHEFRAVLLEMQKCSELMRDETLSLDSLKEFAVDIHADTRRLLYMINDLAHLERIEADQMDICLEWLNINVLITVVVKRIRAMYPHHHILLRLAIALPILLGDREKLTIVISNLLRSMIEFTPEGGTITINSQVQENSVHVSIHNPGPGISASGLKRIFERCADTADRVVSAMHERNQELSMAQKIVQMHGGQVWAESSIRNGSTFHFTICFA